MQTYGVQIIVTKREPVRGGSNYLEHLATVEADGHEDACKKYINTQYSEDLKKWEAEDDCQYFPIDIAAWIISPEAKPKYFDSPTHRLAGGFSS